MTQTDDTGRKAFEARMRGLGLDPAHHDVEGLRAGWDRLSVLLERLEDPARPAGAQTLAVFDPLKPL